MADLCRWGKKSNSRRKLSVKFWLLTPTWNQVLRLAMLKMILRRKKKKRKKKNKNRRRRRRRSSSSSGGGGGGGGSSSKWQITNLGTMSRIEHKYSSFCQSNKRCEKSEAPHIYKNSSPLSVLMLFSQKFFICWWNRPMYNTSNT